MENVHELALVFVQALDLNIEDGARVHDNAVVLENVIREAHLVLVLDVHVLLAAPLIVHIDAELLHLGEVRDPLIADALRNPVGEQRVRVEQETALRDAVGLVVEFLGRELVEVAERLLLKNFGVNLRDTVDREGCRAGHERHAHLAVVDNCHAVFSRLIARELVLDSEQEATVNLLDNLINTRKQAGEELNGPLLECLGHDGVVRVRAGLARNLPRLFPAESLFVHQNAHELRHRDRGVGVVHLEHDIVRELADVVVALQELLDCGLKRRRDEEVLLL